jgi:hypothetical protein
MISLYYIYIFIYTYTYYPAKDNYLPSASKQMRQIVLNNWITSTVVATGDVWTARIQAKYQ